MAGIKGRSGGHNRLSREALVLRGTFRKDRHARPAFADRAVDPAANAAEAVLDDRLAGPLGDAGRALIQKLAPETFTAVEEVFLRVAASRLDAAAAARTLVAKEGLVVDGRRHPLLAVERQAMRDFRDALRDARRTAPSDAQIPAPSDDPFSQFEVRQ